MMTTEIYNRLKINKTSTNDDVMIFETLKEIWQYKYDNEKLYFRIARKINETLQYIHEPLGFWLRNPHPDAKENDFGVVFRGNWHRLNTLDTNGGGLLKTFKDCNIFLRNLKETGVENIKIFDRTVSTNKISIDVNWTDDVEGTYQKILTLIDIVKYNGNKWLHPSNDICKQTMEICAKAMLMGDTGELLFKMYINLFFKNITKLKYSTGLGDPNDRKEGTDCWITHEFDIEDTIQEKTSSYRKDIDGSIITNANFSETSKCTLFSIITYNNIILIKNDNTKNKKIGTTWIFHEDCIVNEIKIINMLEQLKELVRITGKNNITLTITKEGNENSVYYNEEEQNVTIDFPDEYDENIIPMILEITEKLKNIFK